jgi:competence protein ComEC
VAVAAPAGALVAVVVGILVGDARGGAAATDALLAGGAVTTAAIVARRGPARTIGIVLACGLLATACTQRAQHGLDHSPLTDATAARADVRAQAVLVDDPQATRWSVNALVRIRTFSADGPSRDGGGRRVLVTASGDAAGRLARLETGEGLAVEGWLAPLDGFDARERWRHAVAELHVTAVTSVTRATTPLDRVANAAREAVLAGTDPLAPVERAVVAGFLLGDTRALPPSVEEQFRAAGLTHLTAVSGGNVAFVLALAAPVLRRMRLGGRLAVSLAVLVLFGTMTRWEPSVARAITMATIALVAGTLGRPTSGLRALLLAATALLLIDPFLLHSVGFLLSCTASLGIALLARPIAARLPGPQWMREVLAVTAAAQVGVAPVLVPVFGSMPLVALPANLIAVPLAAPLTMWGILSGLISALVEPVAPAVPVILAVPTAALVHALLAVADVAARVPVELDGRAVTGIVAAVALLVALLRARSLRRDARALPPRPAGARPDAPHAGHGHPQPHP